MLVSRGVQHAFEIVLFSAAYDSSMSLMENSGVTFVRRGSP